MEGKAVVKEKGAGPLLLVNGIAAIILGVLLLISPEMTTSVLMVIFGFYLLISGAFSIMWIFSSQRETAWGWLLAFGILGIVGGIVVLNHPAWASLVALTTITLILGIVTFIMGFIRIITAFQGNGWGAGIWGAILIGFGILIIVNLEIATLALPLFIGGWAVAGGLAMAILYFTLKPRHLEHEHLPTSHAP